MTKILFQLWSNLTKPQETKRKDWNPIFVIINAIEPTKEFCSCITLSSFYHWKRISWLQKIRIHPEINCLYQYCVSVIWGLLILVLFQKILTFCDDKGYLYMISSLELYSVMSNSVTNVTHSWFNMKHLSYNCHYFTLSVSPQLILINSLWTWLYKMALHKGIQSLSIELK